MAETGYQESLKVRSRPSHSEVEWLESVPLCSRRKAVSLELHFAKVPRLETAAVHYLPWHHIHDCRLSEPFAYVEGLLQDQVAQLSELAVFDQSSFA